MSWSNLFCLLNMFRPTCDSYKVFFLLFFFPLLERLVKFQDKTFKPTDLSFLKILLLNKVLIL